MIFPWQQEQWQQLWRSKQDNRLPHALLFSGLRGTGKASFAERFSRALLCKAVATDGTVCNQCHMCRLIEGRAHPNVLWVEPEKDGHAIKVDQVRELTDFINHTSLQGDYRVVLIHPANNMNMSAANALLKTLEEPSAGSVIILISDQADRLPATILSRCQRFHFPRPPTAPALQWLQTELADHSVDPELILNLANGAPLSALKLVQDEVLPIRQALFDALYALSQQQGDPVQAAASVQDLESIKLLDFMLSWVMDLLRLQLGGDKSDIVNKDYNRQLSEITERVHFKQSKRFMEELMQYRGKLSQGINLNKQLMIETLLVCWMECTSCS